MKSKGAITNATVYDLEADKNNDLEAILALPKRIRFYHAKINANSLKSGEHYDRLKNVYVIMIMPYDPFGENHMIYTVCNHIKELPDYPYEDGAKTIFLYTRGKRGNPSRELRELLNYMENPTEENACNTDLKDMHRMVNIVKQDEEVSIEYMKAFEHDEMILKQGIQQGRQEAEAEIQRLKREIEALRGRDGSTLAETEKRE